MIRGTTGPLARRDAIAWLRRLCVSWLAVCAAATIPCPLGQALGQQPTTGNRPLVLEPVWEPLLSDSPSAATSPVDVPVLIRFRPRADDPPTANVEPPDGEAVSGQPNVPSIDVPLVPSRGSVFTLPDPGTWQGEQPQGPAATPAVPLPAGQPGRCGPQGCPPRRFGQRPVVQNLFAPLNPWSSYYQDQGPGRPLLGESWLFRPYSAGWNMGMVIGGPLIDDWVGQKHGYFAGFRLAWDLDTRWGCATRLCFGTAELFDSQRAKNARSAADDLLGLAPDDPRRFRYDSRRDSDMVYWDVDLIYYLSDDTAWRPYAMIGMGAARIDFEDRLGQRYAKTVFALPLAFGLRYRLTDGLALQMECADNIAMGGGGFDAVHNFSLTAGLEVLFGGARKAYWPWNPGRHY